LNAAKEKLEIVSGAAEPQFWNFVVGSSSPPQVAKNVRTILRIGHNLALKQNTYTK